MQYQSVSASNNGRILQGGTQDNGTWENDTSQGWVETVGGDGGQSGFNVDNINIRYHSYYNPQHDVNLAAAAPTGWDWIGDPLVRGDVVVLRAVHGRPGPRGHRVRRSTAHLAQTDNGGQRAYLDEHCNELTGDFAPCGDWVTLGGAVTCPATCRGNRPATTSSRSSGPASRPVHDVGGHPARAGVLQRQRQRQGPRRRDLPAPRQGARSSRSVSSRDRCRPERTRTTSYISYSGYSAYSPGGHVYEVTWNPATRTGTAKDIGYDLGDQPITDVVYDQTHRLDLRVDRLGRRPPRHPGAPVELAGRPA